MLVIDVGAYDGSSCSLPLAKNRDNLVYAIEPVPEYANRIIAHDLENLKVFSFAISDQEGSATFYVYGNAKRSSLLQVLQSQEWDTYTDQLMLVSSFEVPVVRLDTFITQNEIAEVDLLNVSAQGFAIQTLQSAGELIRNIKRIILNVQTIPLYKGGSTKAEIVAYLESVGFRLVLSLPKTDGLEERLEFVRVHRYAKFNNAASQFNVGVPYVGSLKMPRNDLVGQLLEQQAFEGPEQAFLWLYLQQGDIFFDCGAHAGLFSCIAAKRLNNRVRGVHGIFFSRIAVNRLQNQSRIFGFEPNPICYEFCKENLDSLGVQNFEILNVGLSDKSGKADLHLGRNGMSAFSTFADGAMSHRQISKDVVNVELVTLDNLISERAIEQVALAKLDVEGWETAVLRGATNSIKQGKFPVWMVEFTEENATAAGSSTQELGDLIESLGYTLCRFDPTRLRLFPETRRLQYSYDNLFAVMDVDSVNERLSLADPFFRNIAQDIVHRWDLAVKARSFDEVEPRYRESEADRAARLEVINHLSANLEECEADRSARLEAINQLTAALEDRKFTQVAYNLIVYFLVRLQFTKSNDEKLGKQ